jgi:hypothetical protein
MQNSVNVAAKRNTGNVDHAYTIETTKLEKI